MPDNLEKQLLIREARMKAPGLGDKLSDFVYQQIEAAKEQPFWKLIEMAGDLFDKGFKGNTDSEWSIAGIPDVPNSGGVPLFRDKSKVASDVLQDMKDAKHASWGKDNKLLHFQSKIKKAPVFYKPEGALFSDTLMSNPEEYVKYWQKTDPKRVDDLVQDLSDYFATQHEPAEFPRWKPAVETAVEDAHKGQQFTGGLRVGGSPVRETPPPDFGKQLDNFYEWLQDNYGMSKTDFWNITDEARADDLIGQWRESSGTKVIKASNGGDPKPQTDAEWADFNDWLGKQGTPAQEFQDWNPEHQYRMFEDWRRGKQAPNSTSMNGIPQPDDAGFSDWLAYKGIDKWDDLPVEEQQRLIDEYTRKHGAPDTTGDPYETAELDERGLPIIDGVSMEPPDTALHIFDKRGRLIGGGGNDRKYFEDLYPPSEGYTIKENPNYKGSESVSDFPDDSVPDMALPPPDRYPNDDYVKWLWEKHRTDIDELSDAEDFKFYQMWAKENPDHPQALTPSETSLTNDLAEAIEKHGVDPDNPITELRLEEYDAFDDFLKEIGFSLETFEDLSVDMQRMLVNNFKNR